MPRAGRRVVCRFKPSVDRADRPSMRIPTWPRMLRRHVFRVALVSCSLVPPLASAATVPMNGTPLAVHLGDRSQLQAFETGSTSGIFYPPSGTAGDAGFFLAFPTGAPAAITGRVYGFSGA